jgi:DnaJ-class molecular chaperone
MTILTRTCPKCRGEGEYPTSRYGGNDPDVTMRHCTKCDGHGELEVPCEGFACSESATEEVTFPCGSVEAYCRLCAVTAREDAGMDCEPKGFW